MPEKSEKALAPEAAPASWGVPAQGFDSLLNANAKAAEIWLDSWTRIAGESAGFLSRRWKQDLNLLERIMACKTPLELLQVQSEFMQRALVDYMQETGKLADMETEAGVSELEALDEGARQAANSRRKSSGKS